jgi:hypothetical protein
VRNTAGPSAQVAAARERAAAAHDSRLAMLQKKGWTDPLWGAHSPLNAEARRDRPAGRPEPAPGGVTKASL